MVRLTFNKGQVCKPTRRKRSGNAGCLSDVRDVRGGVEKHVRSRTPREEYLTHHTSIITPNDLVKLRITTPEPTPRKLNPIVDSTRLRLVARGGTWLSKAVCYEGAGRFTLYGRGRASWRESESVILASKPKLLEKDSTTTQTHSKNLNTTTSRALRGRVG